MKVVAFVVALTVAACSFAMAANTTTKAATNNGANSSTNNGANWTTTNGTNGMANNGTNSSTNNGTNGTTNNGTNGTTNNGTNGTNNNGTNGTANNGTNWTNNNGTNGKTNNANTGANWSNNTGTNATANANVSTQDLTRVSHEGFNAMRAVRAARVAIFNGQTQVVTQLLNQARTDLQAATKGARAFVTTMDTTTNGNVVVDNMAVGQVNWIPIDGQVSLADTFVASPAKTQHIQNANQHFKNGHSKQAIEELRLAAIDVTCTRVLMSLQATTKCVAEATKLVGQQKYYEANLALKAAEDGLVVDSASLDQTVPSKNTTQKEID